MKITWFGHATFKIETSERILYIDPYVLPKGSPLADIILVTHDHYDHCDPSKVNEIRTERTQVVATEKAAAKLGGNVKTVNVGDSLEMEGIKILAVDAYNVSKPFHPKGVGVGFIIESEGKSVYHTGDSDFIPEMNEFQGLTAVLIPIGGTYTMDTEQAKEAILAMKPKFAIPMHYNFLEGLNANAGEFKQKVESKGETKVEILEGRELEI
ncbi:MAG: MBL fold metallo-hydrolase [Candidatus Aenigmarchaeota archaeon]|nr:MBL fold metallo-hydrolase [Candidatus Aenigmarchaeota archaeon]NIP40533.1 MBL fold metallo-hydrolase [Candidatus Aenigmarchaeota archaeon]NIQ18378.1 MBL fold metallo-hydrolase [Candidatus Aenigmarchaeota archaeon]